MLTPYVRAILQATVYDVAIRTPLEPAAKLSTRFDNNIRLKREDLQPVFSFKLRGAYNKISQLSDAQNKKASSVHRQATMPKVWRILPAA